MAIFRILDATARPGSVDRVIELLVQQGRGVATGAPGAVFVQTLRSGDNVLAVSSWETLEHMERYLDEQVTRDFYRALPELLMGVPTVRTYEVVEPGDGAGWGTAAGAATGAGS